ncbi:hypothetical protein DFH09DRAFT_1093151 [Mycena vulgaris]|nr:hypothetical protein DFH09DRAFT_1093151 [Mycena vulgaris]
MHPICVPPPIPRNSTPPRIQLLRLVYATQVPSYRPLSPPLPPPPPPVSGSPVSIQYSDSESRLNPDSHSRLGLAARAVSQARCKRSTISVQASLYLPRVHFQDSQAAVSGSILILSLAQDSPPRKYTFILAPHAPRTTRLGLGRDSDTRTEEKGKRMYWAWACTNMWYSERRSRKRGAAGTHMHSAADDACAPRERERTRLWDADAHHAQGKAGGAGVECGCATTMCAEEVCGPRAGRSASTPPRSRHRTSSASSPTRHRRTAAPPRHGTPPPHSRRRGGRKDGTRATEIEERRKTTHQTGMSGRVLGAEPLLLCVRAVVDAGEDGAGEGVLCLVSLSLSFKEEDNCRTSLQTPNTPPAPPRHREQNAHQCLRLTQPCLNRIDGPLGWGALPAGVQEPARTAQSRRARCDEAPALGACAQRRGRGLSGVERGEGCIRVFGVHVVGGRGGGRGVHVVVVVGGRRRRRRRAVVVLREALGYEQPTVGPRTTASATRARAPAAIRRARGRRRVLQRWGERDGARPMIRGRSVRAMEVSMGLAGWRSGCRWRKASPGVLRLTPHSMCSLPGAGVPALTVRKYLFLCNQIFRSLSSKSTSDLHAKVFIASPSSHQIQDVGFEDIQNYFFLQVV